MMVPAPQILKNKKPKQNTPHNQPPFLVCAHIHMYLSTFNYMEASSTSQAPGSWSGWHRLTVTMTSMAAPSVGTCWAGLGSLGRHTHSSTQSPGQHPSPLSHTHLLHHFLDELIGCTQVLGVRALQQAGQHLGKQGVQ